MSSAMPDTELKARHRAMWASGDYPSMVETFLLPLGPRLVEACGIGPGMRVLDVAAGTGNASLPAAKTGADVTASDCHPLASSFLAHNLQLNGLPPMPYRHGHWTAAGPALGPGTALVALASSRRTGLSG